MENSWIGFLVFLGTFLAGRWLSENALKLLTSEERKKLIKGLSLYRVITPLGIVLLIIIHYATKSFSPSSSLANSSILVGILVFYLLGSTAYSFKKLKDMQMPDKYINQVLFSTFVEYLGLFVFFGFVLNAK